jgi:hypothetical protein
VGSTPTGLTKKTKDESMINRSGAEPKSVALLPVLFQRRLASKKRKASFCEQKEAKKLYTFGSCW